MEDKEIVGGKIGSVGSFDVAFKEGALKAEASVALPVGKAVVSVEIGGKQLLDLVAAEAKAKTGSDIPVEIAVFLEKALGLV